MGKLSTICPFLKNREDDEEEEEEKERGKGKRERGERKGGRTFLS